MNFRIALCVGHVRERPQLLLRVFFFFLYERQVAWYRFSAAPKFLRQGSFRRNVGRHPFPGLAHGADLQVGGEILVARSARQTEACWRSFGGVYHQPVRGCRNWLCLGSHYISPHCKHLGRRVDLALPSNCATRAQALSSLISTMRDASRWPLRAVEATLRLSTGGFSLCLRAPASNADATYIEDE